MNHVSPAVTVIDAIMGAGKTHYAINTMNTLNTEAIFGEGVTTPDRPRWIYITPFLSEVQRVKTGSPDLEFEEPTDIDFGAKRIHFEHLIRQGRNVVTTHSLFPRLTPEGLTALREHGYRLIIDEAVETVSVYHLNTKQRRFLLESGMMVVDEEGRCHWQFDDKRGQLETRYEDVKELCSTGSLFLFEDTCLIWELPREILDSFLEITVLTYLFEGSTLAAFMRAEEIPYHVLGIQPSTGLLVPREEVDEQPVKEEVRRKLKLYEGRRNRIGDFRQKGTRQAREKLTLTHLQKSLGEDDRREITSAASGFIRHDAKAPSRKVAWTTFKDFRSKLAGSRYTDDSCFISLNARATNDYEHKEAMVYLANRFVNPSLIKYLRAKGVEMQEDVWALSEMLQWLWRGCIRRCPRDPSAPDMHVFVPAERMRDLLKAWLGSDTYDELRAAI